MDGMKDPRLPLYMTKNKDEILKAGYSKKTEDKVITYYKGENKVDRSEAVLVDANKGYYGIGFAFDIPAKPNAWSDIFTMA